MDFEKLKIPATDGYQLSANLFKTKGDVNGCVIIGSAMAAHKTYYRHFADYLTENGYHAITFDYRGVGASLHDNIKSFQGSILDWGMKDLTGIRRWAEKNTETDNLLFVGHSVAGQLFPLMQENYKIKAAYLVGSQMAYNGHWSGKEKLYVRLFWHVIIPVCTRVFGYLPAWAIGGGVHLPASIAREWRAFGLHPHGILEDDPIRRSQFSDVQTPTRFIGMTDDLMLAPPRSVEALKDNYGGNVIDLKILDPKDIRATRIEHFGFFRKKFQDTLWEDVLKWFEKSQKLEVSPSAPGC